MSRLTSASASYGVRDGAVREILDQLCPQLGLCASAGVDIGRGILELAALLSGTCSTGSPAWKGHVVTVCPP